MAGARLDTAGEMGYKSRGLGGRAAAAWDDMTGSRRDLRAQPSVRTVCWLRNRQDGVGVAAPTHETLGK